MNNATLSPEAQAYAKFHDLSTIVASDMGNGRTVTPSEVDCVESALNEIESFCETDLERQIATEGRREFVAEARAYARPARV